MKKIITIVGARPQFIKTAVVSRELRKYYREIIVHTGQHYDYNMSDVFFKELEIPKPDYNLGISGGRHGKMTGEMLIAIESVLVKEMPDMVIIYGDTNSTLAGALAAVKLHIPICHIEAGSRLGTLKNPEEVNRIITDHISSLLMCCTESAVDCLKKEGKRDNVFLTGDPMYDAFEFYKEKVLCKQPEDLVTLDNDIVDLPKSYYYMTCHREENAGEENTLIQILSAMEALAYPCIYPVHPRNQKKVLALKKAYKFNNVIVCNPVGYLMSIFLILHAEKIITDSGGLQREAFFAQKQCVTIFDHVVWPETMIDNRNQLAKADKEDILCKLRKEQVIRPMVMPFGNGHSAEKIVETITNYISSIG